MSEQNEQYDFGSENVPAVKEERKSEAITVYRPQFDVERLKPGTAIKVKAGTAIKVKAGHGSWGYKHTVNAIITDVSPLNLGFVYVGAALDKYNHRDSEVSERRHDVGIHEVDSLEVRIEIIQEVNA
ncbi:hypothetical protein [Exiguobacterium sp. s162]|uniref:hypothetical protein n=1 Tax=Exiguobacterium sp. s162 TaxID=2751276 RepID=UPI001BECEDE3|nr:hypothetical protein [Exiguobacterium sp. s162]